ncbi:hypothetical protein BGZ96_000615 [Linnemannia gamsii]|uniref:Uncharacterized protein n=1 Tax=Linnemannia gamsii TaxID=64522 RepID=A0ABQ7KBH8_9FUNG|nr:hypothetical protein BGZ96_000615 [Linnemannia gamsii]
MAMEQDRSHSAPQKSALSPLLSDFLGLVRSSNNPSRNDSSVVDSLVAFRQNTQAPLSLQDLTIAFRKSLLYARPSALHTKVFVTDWLSDLVKSSSHTKAPTAVIQELAKVSDQLNLSRQETEEWMPLLISLCNLTDSCLGVVRGLTQSALASFVEDQACIMLASIILETGTRVFRHLDRSQVKRARSEGYMTWNQRTLDMTKSFLEFTEQVLQINGVKEHASDMVIAGTIAEQNAWIACACGLISKIAPLTYKAVCNMFLRYAEDARSEYAYLNITFKSIVLLVPNCVENRNFRLEKLAVIRLLCDGVHGTILDVYRTCVDNAKVIDGFFKRRWTLARFYMAHFKMLVSSLFKDICSAGDEAVACRGLLRYLLFFLRGRVCSNGVIRKRYPEIQLEMMKFVNVVEEVIILGIFSSQTAYDEDKRATLQEFSTSPGPRAVFDNSDALTEQEWIIGRLYFLLKTITLFDEFSPSLQHQLYPVEKGSSYDSPFTRIVESLRSLDLQEFLPLATQDADQDYGDVYTRTLTELVTFAHLIEPRQFAKLQIDMVGLVLGPTELLSLLAVDWWTCISARFGQRYTTSQVIVLMELLSTLPIGRSSQKVRLLLCSMLPQLDESSQANVINSLMMLLDRMADNEQSTLLSCFPYECLGGSSLDSLVNKCADGWENACNLLVRDERLVLEAFYALPQHVLCLSSIYNNPALNARLSPNLRVTLIGWSTGILGGINDLLFQVQNDQHALAKISCTAEAIVEFLRSTGPLQCEEMIQVLSAFYSWTKLPPFRQPLSKLLMARFLASCSAVDITDSTQMEKIEALLTALYECLLRENDWTIVHETLNSLAVLSKNTRYPQLSQRCIPVPARHLVQNIQEMESGEMVPTDDSWRFWATFRGRMKCVDTPSFSGNTVLNLQNQRREQPSTVACLSALTTATRYLETLHNQGKVDPVFLSRLATELSRLQNLVTSRP